MMDEIIPRVNDPLAVYVMTSRVINDLFGPPPATPSESVTTASPKIGL